MRTGPLVAIVSALALVAGACGSASSRPCDAAAWIGSPEHRIAPDGSTSGYSVGLDGSVRPAEVRRLRPTSYGLVGATDPAGRRSAEWQQNGDRRLVLRGDGPAITIARGVSSQPIWRPDGLAIAFGKAGSLHVAAAADGWRTRNLGVAICSLGGPAWSPDGNLLALVSPRDHDRCEAGASLVVLDARSGAAIGHEDTTAAVPMQPAWSPDGRFAAESPAVTPTGIALVPRSPSVGRARVLRRCTASWWAPSGARLVAGCDGHLVLVAADTGARVDYDTPAVGPGLGPVWSTDGHRFALLADGTILVATDDGRATLVRMGGCLSVTVQRFARDGRRVLVTAAPQTGGD